MEFNFNITKYFKDEITKVGSRLIPDGFFGDRREVQDCLSKVSYILTILGEKSAKAQGLQKVITSGEKLRNSDHVVYILIDPQGGTRGYGTVVGMLKMGVKHLYVFDAGGNNHEVTTKCVLDFYVHESKQRMGLGKKLFQHMLKEERVDPVHLAIDKPSSKFLSFLLKHYGLKTIIPQMNNFVVFDGFFTGRSFGDKTGGKEKTVEDGKNTVGGRCASESAEHISSSPSRSQLQSVSTVNLNHGSYYGRQAPHKPISTMGMILQHRSSTSQQAPANGSSTEEVKIPEIEPLTLQNEVEIKNTEINSLPDIPAEEKEQQEKEEEEEKAAEKEEKIENNTPCGDTCSPAENNNNETPNAETLKTPTTPPNQKIRVNSQGYMDLKFYHSNLCQLPHEHLSRSIFPHTQIRSLERGNITSFLKQKSEQHHELGIKILKKGPSQQNNSAQTVTISNNNSKDSISCL